MRKPPREPTHSARRARRAPPQPAGATEPFVRLATLATRERAAAYEATYPATHEATYEERTGALIKKASAPVGLDDERLDRLWVRLQSAKTVRARRWAVSPVRWAVVVAVLLISGGLVGAATKVWTWPSVMAGRFTTKAPAVAVPAANHPRPPGRKLAAKADRLAAEADRLAAEADRLAAEASTIGAPPADEPAAVESSPAAPAPLVGPPPSGEPPAGRASASRRHADRDRAVALPTSPAPATAPDTTLAAESLLLGRALSRLRVERDGAGALVELDRYSERFPTGLLRHEAQSARVDALLTVGRLADARTVLTGLTFGRGARDRELRLIRAELTAEKDCAAALPDYEAVLADSSAGPLAERALWGRAACRARLGDERGARTDLAAYLDRFPAGGHAAMARARLRN